MIAAVLVSFGVLPVSMLIAYRSGARAGDRRARRVTTSIIAAAENDLQMAVVLDNDTRSVLCVGRRLMPLTVARDARIAVFQAHD